MTDPTRAYISMGWQAGTSESICGTINLFPDEIKFRVYVPVSTGAPSTFQGGQCFSNYYVDVYIKRVYSGTLDRVFVNYGGVWAGPIVGVTFELNKAHDYIGDGKYSDEYRVYLVYAAGSGKSYAGTLYPEYEQWKIVAVRRVDGTTEAQDIAQCGTIGGGCTLSLVSPTAELKYRRAFPGSRVAVERFSSNGQLGARIVEYLPVPDLFSPGGGGIPTTFTVGEWLSPAGCDKYPVIEWRCDGSCDGGECPPNTCHKCYDAVNKRVCCYDENGMIIGYSNLYCEPNSCL